MKEKEEISIILRVDEKQIQMNLFVQSVFVNVIKALVDSLDKIPQDRSKIEILLKS